MAKYRQPGLTANRDSCNDYLQRHEIVYIQVEHDPQTIKQH